MTSCVSGTVSGIGDKLGARLKSSYSCWLHGVKGPTSPSSYEHHEVNRDVPGQHELEKNSSQLSWLAWVLLNGVYKPDGKTELLRAIEGIFSALTKQDFSESISSSKETRLTHIKIEISKRNLAYMLLYYMEGNEIIHGKYSAPCLKHTKNQYHLVVIIRRRRWHPTPVLLPGKSHGRRNLVGCSPWGRWELDTTQWLHFQFSLSCIGEGNGNPLQCSCLENPRDSGAWWAAVYGGAQSWTRLRWLSSSRTFKYFNFSSFNIFLVF